MLHEMIKVVWCWGQLSSCFVPTRSRCGQPIFDNGVRTCWDSVGQSKRRLDISFPTASASGFTFTWLMTEIPRTLPWRGPWKSMEAHGHWKNPETSTMESCIKTFVDVHEGYHVKCSAGIFMESAVEGSVRWHLSLILHTAIISMNTYM